MDQITNLQKQIDDIKRQLEKVDNDRVYQHDIVPGAVKMRHMGEANKFVRAGTATNKPTTGETGTDSLAMYYDTTNNKLWVFNGSWKSVTLT